MRRFTAEGAEIAEGSQVEVSFVWHFGTFWGISAMGRARGSSAAGAALTPTLSREWERVREKSSGVRHFENVRRFETPSKSPSIFVYSICLAVLRPSSRGV